MRPRYGRDAEKLNFSQKFLTNIGERILWAEVLALHPEDAGAWRSLGQEEGDEVVLVHDIIILHPLSSRSASGARCCRRRSRGKWMENNYIMN